MRSVNKFQLDCLMIAETREKARVRIAPEKVLEVAQNDLLGRLLRKSHKTRIKVLANSRTAAPSAPSQSSCMLPAASPGLA